MVAYTYEKCPREANKGIWLERENNGERDMRSAVPTKKKNFKLSFALEPPVERYKHFRLGRVGLGAHACGEGGEGACMEGCVLGGGRGVILPVNMEPGAWVHLADVLHKLTRRTGPCMDLRCEV